MIEGRFVPNKYVSPSTYKLGMMLADVRSKELFLKKNDEEGEGVTKLERVDVELSRFRVGDFQKEMEDYVDENGRLCSKDVLVSKWE